jgi:hypothetical protein
MIHFQKRQGKRMVETLKKIPRNDIFVNGVLFFGVVLCHLQWILYLGNVLTLGGNTRIAAWASIWSNFNFLAHIFNAILIVTVLRRRMNRKLVLPAIFLSLLDIGAGIAIGIANILFRNFFGSVVIAIIVALTVYYVRGLKTIYDDLEAEMAAVSQTAVDCDDKFFIAGVIDTGEQPSAGVV